jgi:phosphoglycerate dehydrogenase-like enzyme
MKIAFLDPLEARLAEFPDRYLNGHDVLVTHERGGLPEGVEGAEALVWWSYPVDQWLIERLPKLRFLQRIGVLRTKGDTTTAMAKGIPVSALPFGVSDRVAQHALAMTLSIMRKLRQGHAGMIEGLNPSNMPEEETGAPAIATNWTGTPDVDTLNDKTIGIIGFGEIGACLARMVAPFDCRVLYYKRNRLRPELEAFFGGITYAGLEDLLHQSDVVEAIIPYSEDSRKMLGAREFGLMKPGAIFINVGRGNTVDEPALIEALNNGTIAHAGLDVFAVEPLPVSSSFLRMDNVVLSPHSAGGVLGWVNTFERIADNLRRVEAGEPVLRPMASRDPQF